MNTQKLNSAIAEFTKKKKSNAAYYEENWAERKERKEYYQSFTKDILGAVKMAGVWLLPKTAEKPMDACTKDFRKIDK